MGAKDGWFWTRRISLFGLILFASGLIASLTIWQNPIWAIVFGVLFSVVLAAEAICYIRFKKTISTVYGEFLQANRLKGYAGLVLFSLSMVCLVIHLGAYSKED